MLVVTSLTTAAAYSPPPLYDEGEVATNLYRQITDIVECGSDGMPVLVGASAGPFGAGASAAYASGMVLASARAGVDVRVEPNLELAYGKRLAAPVGNEATRLQVVLDGDTAPAGRVVARAAGASVYQTNRVGASSAQDC